MADINNSSDILTSDWTGLSPHLIARFYPIKKLSDGSGWEPITGFNEISAADKFVVYDANEVQGPITDGTIESAMNWTSPFEGAGAESKAPALSAMLQSGSLSPTLQAMASAAGIDSKNVSSIQDFLTKANGRSGITKLNSTQIFTGMAPVKMSMTLHFRALKDPKKEVDDPLMQLEEWYLPQMLATDGLIAGALNNGANRGMIETIFPSKAPQIIGFRYGNMTWQPMVIESMSKPFTNPRSPKGVLLSCSVQISLSTLSALDRRDVRKIYR